MIKKTKKSHYRRDAVVPTFCKEIRDIAQIL